MITLYQYYPCWNLSSGSPFCVKLELHLKMLGVEYHSERLRDPRSAPKKKLPFIEDDGVRVADSGMIIEYLKQKHGIDLDSHLSDEQKAVSLAFRRMLEEYVYWIIVYSRWIDADNWKITNREYFAKLPPVINQILPVILRRNIRKAIRAQGLGLHNSSDMYQLGVDSLKAVACFLDDKAYFFNYRPSSIDAVAYAFLSATIDAPIASPLEEYVKSEPTLMGYLDNIKQRYFG